MVASHGPTKHTVGCECHRCRGLQPGHTLSVGHGRPPTHGAYALVRQAPRAEEISGFVREAMGAAYSPRFELAVQSAGPLGARYEAALLALVEGDPAQLERLDRDARGWARLWFSILDKLGLTPLAASRQGLNLALGEDAAFRALQRHLAQNYDGGEG